MTGLATSTAVDLSQLPSPALVEALDFETIYNRNLAQLQELMPEFTATEESDPAIKLLQIAAFRELALRARVNDAAKAVMVAYAQGADLDHLAAVFGVTRLLITPADPPSGQEEVKESDTELRRRVLLAPEGYSVAGPEGAYIFHALSSDPDALDASATSPEPDNIRDAVNNALEAQEASSAIINAVNAALDAARWPGEVIVTVLSRHGDGTADPEMIATVDAYLTDEKRRPLTDFVTVQGADIIEYQVTAEIFTFIGPDSAIVLAEARTRLDAYIADNHRLGRDITRSGILAALHCPGVQNVVLASPAADIVLDRTQASFCTAVSITHAGHGE